MESENKNKEYFFQVLLVGDRNVGKSEIMQKYAYTLIKNYFLH